MNKEDLLNSKSFCILPFVQACIWQDGFVQACCINSHRLGSMYDNVPIQEVFSAKNEKLKEFRKEFLTGKLPDSCFKCKENEDVYNSPSYRIDSLGTYGYLIDDLDTTSEETLINNDKVFLWDIRFSNLCNLKCLICTGSDSSRLAEEQNHRPALFKAFEDPTEFIKFFEDQIDNLQEIYFVGGEPLLIAEHYKILDLLIKHKKFKVTLRYNTNGTTISLGNKRVTDYWKHFKVVEVSASIDAGWEQLEYIRNGAKWDDVLENLREIKREAPHIKLVLGIVLTVLNLFYIRKLYNFLVAEDLLNPSYLNLMNVYDRDFYRPTILPNRLKEKALEHYRNWKYEVEHYSSDNPAKSTLLQRINFVIGVLNSKDTNNKLQEFKEKTLYYDKIRGTDFFKTFGELEGIFEDEPN